MSYPVGAGSFSDTSVHAPDLREIDHVVVRWIVDAADLAGTPLSLMAQAGVDELLKGYLSRSKEHLQESSLFWGARLLELFKCRYR